MSLIAKAVGAPANQENIDNKVTGWSRYEKKYNKAKKERVI